MAEVDAEIPEGDEEEGTGAAPKRRLAGKVLVLYVVLPVLLLVGAGVGVYMSGLLGGGESEEAVAEVVVPDPVFFDLPDFLVNLSGPPPQHYLKMRVALQITSKEAVPQLELQMPRVLDGFQTFLRELRPEDLEGSRGMLYLKEELLRRLNLATQEPIVTDVLFKEIIVQ
ncbi:MAG: flagellar basal body protein FliL [Alphaproteobacteria bacterium HGW-Alphaproteobacteria-12]|nr:MAG: flagellar basal body protein FliL [Alphaproteobacteria bacterium HGW-Alphaproteobacteria-12]